MKLAKEPPSSLEECFIQFLTRARESRKERLKTARKVDLSALTVARADQRWIKERSKMDQREIKADKSRAAEARARKHKLTLKGQIEELKSQLVNKNSLISELEKKIKDLEETRVKLQGSNRSTIEHSNLYSNKHY
ncbi:hypothetical protein DERP_008026 [Dermatophagoides pteronyssinus]|uniref:BZIP domain-containing protein n=1 Tax=Dermatophagoides pteronyssinus TaxID=6956 RepID=A0ABQ8ITD1_DERPT|nr:hypothetical protein DERP_008026 [Dermatophagoides pteronyssinus]